MKKIIILALSVLFVLCVLSCDGSVYSSVVNSSEKSVTFKIINDTEYEFKESGDTAVFTTTAETWQELAVLNSELGLTIVDKDTSSEINDFKFYDSGEAGMLVSGVICIMASTSISAVYNSNDYDYTMLNEEIEDGKTYYLYLWGG